MLTDKQLAALALGRQKGINHLSGIPKSDESKRKRSTSIKAWCAANPDKVLARGAKNSGPNNYRWNGGSSRLNTAIRRLTENRKWMDEIKARDRQCTRCGSEQGLESHHKTGLAVLIEQLGIASRDDARQHAAVLWDLDNGVTLCQPCHYDEHGRKRHAD